MMAMLSAGMYDQDSIRIGMNPATYDLLLLQGSCEGFFIKQNANMRSGVPPALFLTFGG